jgi:hypothetical protein
MDDVLVIGGKSRAATQRVEAAIRNGIGWCLEKFKAPAKLRVFEFVDPSSDETVYLYTSKSYSVLCIGDRRFYFDRITGKFDGISSPPATLRVADGLKLSD